MNFSELFRINLDELLFIEADDHYTRAYMVSGYKVLLPFGLSRVEEAIAEAYRSENLVNDNIVRLGRCYIVNVLHVFHINLIKQLVMLSDTKGNVYSLHISKAVLRQLFERMSV